MTNEKGIAINFYYKFYQLVADKENAVNCAILAIDEIIFEKRECHNFECSGRDLKVWKKVKKELEGLSIKIHEKRKQRR